MSDRMQQHTAPEKPWYRTPFGLVVCGFMLIAGFLLLTEHAAHLFGLLPYLLILACPLMHLFMHHGHGHHHGGGNNPRDGEDRS